MEKWNVVELEVVSRRGEVLNSRMLDGRMFFEVRSGLFLLLGMLKNDGDFEKRKHLTTLSKQLKKFVKRCDKQKVDRQLYDWRNFDAGAFQLRVGQGYRKVTLVLDTYDVELIVEGLRARYAIMRQVEGYYSGTVTDATNAFLSMLRCYEGYTRDWYEFFK